LRSISGSRGPFPAPRSRPSRRSCAARRSRASPSPRRRAPSSSPPIRPNTSATPPSAWNSSSSPQPSWTPRS